MVARPDTSGDARPPAATRAAALFLMWRRALTSLLVAAERTAVRIPRAALRLAAFPSLLLRFAARPAEAFATPAARRGLAAAGLVSLAAGAALSFALAPALRVPPADSGVAALWTLGWAGLRLGVLMVTTRRSSASAVSLAWAAGLLPSVVGLTAELRVLAFAASAWLTLGALRGGGSDEGDARRATAWAFGAEVAGWAARWIGLNVLLFLAASR